MSSNQRLSACLVLVALLSSLVTGCAAEPSGPGSDATPTPTATPTPEPVARPASQWGIDCAHLVPSAALDTVVGVDLAADDREWALPWVGFTTNAAILQAGGVVCSWRTGTGPSAIWKLTVLPGSADGFQADVDYLTGQEHGAWTPVDAFDGAAANCTGRTDDRNGMRCRWIALSDGNYVALDFWGVRAGEVENPDPAPNADSSIPPLRPSGTATLALLEGVFSAIKAAPVVALEPLPAAAPTCADLLTKEAVAAALGVDASQVNAARADREPDAPLAAIGGSSCFASTDDLYVRATLAPGLGWAIDRALADDSALSAGPLAGFDRGVVKCGPDEGGAYCVSAAIDDAGVLLSLTVTSSGAAPTRDMAEALLATLG